MRDPGRRPGFVRIVVAALGLAGWPAPSGAQPTTLGAVSRAAPSRAPSVIVPHPGIDPGMRVTPPRLPPDTGGVVKPRTTPAPGSDIVVVPR